MYKYDRRFIDLVRVFVLLLYCRYVAAFISSTGVVASRGASYSTRTSIATVQYSRSRHRYVPVLLCEDFNWAVRQSSAAQKSET